MTGLRSRFDWYECTADGDPDGRTAASLAVVLRAQLVRGRGQLGYAECWQLVRVDEVVCEVFGRSARLGEVHVRVSSDSCDEVVPLLRRMLPAHRVSRADSAVDFRADFEQLRSRALSFATGRGLVYSEITNSAGGATFTIGSLKSEVFMRLYKKTEQLRALHPERWSEIPEGIVRFELVARPGKRAVKDLVSAMHSDDLWGLSAWSKELATELLQLDAERTATHFRRPTNYARTLHFVGKQFGPMMRQRASEVGAALALRELTEALGL
jgi:hypothetical protein